MKECRRAARLGVIIALLACGPLGCGENGNDDTGVHERLRVALISRGPSLESKFVALLAKARARG